LIIVFLPFFVEHFNGGKKRLARIAPKKEMPPRMAASPLKNGGLEIGQEGLATG
jgi:hypothetical protein